MTEHNWPCKRRGVDRAFRTLAGARSSWGESRHQRVWSCPWRPDRTRSKAWQTRQDGGGPRWTSPWCSDETDLVTNSILSSWIFFTIKDQWKSVIFNREQYLHKLYPDGVVTVLPLYPGKRDSVFVSLQSKIQRGGQVWDAWEVPVSA